MAIKDEPNQATLQFATLQQRDWWSSEQKTNRREHEVLSGRFVCGLLGMMFEADTVADAATMFAEALIDMRPWDYWSMTGSRNRHHGDRRYARGGAPTESGTPAASK